MINFEVDRMKIRDLDQVMRIERNAFTMPWNRWMFEKELQNPDRSHFLVIRDGKNVVGYIGFWLLVDEAHIVTIAVRQDYRQRGAGSLLMASALNLAEKLNADKVTLEVRVSNHSAQNLYKKFGFKAVAIRRRFYSDTGEDAYIMWIYDLKEKIGEINAIAWRIIHNEEDESMQETIKD
ncbi:ribosomal-protein-alanine N-acetyltransferase [Candidatus Poribacteria bacterium]|nr:ribosomal-protein-alanine N-acetyltransferase [Candidatus Poribacteria bacterium]